MIIDRWKVCGRKTNRQIKKRRQGMMKSKIIDYKTIIIMIIKNNNNIL